MACAWLVSHATLGDYPAEAGSAMRALLAGDLRDFLTTMPTYGGSLLLRAPAALIAGSEASPLAVYRTGAALCIAAFAVLVGAIAWRRRDRPAMALGILAIGLLNPIVVKALAFGHPEELLGSALAISALLLALDARPAPAGLALGVALVCKQWTAVAIVPVLLSLDSGRVRAAVAAAAPVAAWAAFVELLSPGGMAASVAGARAGGTIGTPFEVFALITHQAAASGVHRVPEAVGTWAHTGIVLLAVAVAVAAAAVGRGVRSDRSRWMAVLALVLLLRCAFDPADNLYYHLPFLTALLAYETLRRRAPLATLLAGSSLWLVFGTLSASGSRTLLIAAYLTIAAAATAWLGREVFACPPAPRI